VPIVDKYKDTVVMGKVETGEAKKGQSLLVMPNRVCICFFLFLKLIYVTLNSNYILHWRKIAFLNFFFKFGKFLMEE